MKHTNTNALISGAGGFIGQHLATALKESDITPISIPRDTLYKLPALMYFCNRQPFSSVYHLASYGNMAHQQEEDKIIMANYFATWNLLKATAFTDYEAFINVSSSSVLLSHETFYSASKAGAERLVNAYAEQYKKPVISFRPFSIYGPGEASFRFIPTVFDSCLNGTPMKLSPDAVHDWVYVSDCVKSLLGVANAVSMSELFETYNCGTGVGTTNQQVVHLIEEITGKRANIVERLELRSFDSKHWIHEDIEPGMIQLWDGLQLYYEDYKMRQASGK